MKEDNVIFDIIEREHQRQKKGIELIASENFVSEQVMRAMGSCLTFCTEITPVTLSDGVKKRIADAVLFLRVAIYPTVLVLLREKL